MQPQADPYIAPVCHGKIKILYQDEYLLIINKPTGLLSLSGRHPDNWDSAYYRLIKDFPTANLVHRLDMGTSGLLIVALNKAVNGHIGKQFQNGTVKKTYVAILDGLLLDDEGQINVPIAKGVFPQQKACYETGKQAATYYQVLERDFAQQTTRVLFKPITGRTHQLRIHSAQISHPILGCDLYATDQAFFKADRLMLHASHISFTHPITLNQITLDCPAPF